MLQTKNLQSIMGKYYDDLVFSLKASGLDISADNWESAIIDRNAYKSAGILIAVACRNLKCRDIFLQAIITGCHRESMLLETMDMICAAFERIGALPPLGIIQHALNPDLLKLYCIELARWLEKYLQATPDSIPLCPEFMVESLK